MTEILAPSVGIIREHQAPSGGYPASPTFAPYRYCWLRDGSFIADAMSRVGEVGSAEAFFDWCGRVIEARGGENLHARYTLDGEESESDWPTFQPDGYGLWLWALVSHCERHGRAPDRWLGAVDLTRAYLHRHWREPCTDWWEERVDVHLSTLGSIWMGLHALKDSLAEEVAQELERCSTSMRLDASLLVLLPPFGPWSPEPLLELIERGLVSAGGGVHRHAADTYYGGGEWVLLTAMLGSVYAAVRRMDDARAKLDWVYGHAEQDGALPEQVLDHLLHPESRRYWLEKWGPPASPLLWSHAMAIRLAVEAGG
jgi:isomaltose glucohydrolase